MQFDEVKPEHFSTISRDPFPHILIDRALMQLGGNDSRAAKFRTEALAAAGWAHSNLVPFGRYPDQRVGAGPGRRGSKLFTSWQMIARMPASV